MSHSIKTGISESIDFSIGQRNYILYLYGSLNSENFCSEQCWSGIGESKKFTRKEIEESFCKLKEMHKKDSLDTSLFSSKLPDDFKEKRVSKSFWGATVINCPPISREESFNHIYQWYQSLLNESFETVVINFSQLQRTQSAKRCYQLLLIMDVLAFVIISLIFTNLKSKHMEGQAKSDFVKSEIQGCYKLELKFVDNRVFLNYQDWAHGRDVCVEVKDQKLLEFIYSEDEIQSEEFEGDAFEQKEISIFDFVEKVKKSISQISV